MNDLLVSGVLLLPWAGAGILLLVSRRDWVYPIAVLLGCVVALLSIVLLLAPPTDIVVLPFGQYHADGLSAPLVAIAACIGALALIFSGAYLPGDSDLRRYYALILIFIGAMTGLVLSNSLLLLLIFWEVTALCSFALIAYHSDDPRASRGGLQALIVTQIGGVGLFAAILGIRAALGTDQIDVFLAQASTMAPELLAFVAVGVLLAAAAKSAQIPFQFWLPGAMEAPTPVSALIHAATMVNAGVYLLARFYAPLETVPHWANAIVLMGLLTALLGAWLALVADDLKRVLAYSTVSQLGYMVCAVGAGAIFASQFHLLSHAIFKALLFLGAGAVIHAAGTRDMRQMGGLARSMPFTHWTFLIGGLALAGIPLFNGFWSKDLILEGVHEHAPEWVVWALLGVGLITALYVLRMLWLVFYSPSRASGHIHDAPLAMRIPLGLLAVGTVSSWLLAAPLYKWQTTAVDPAHADPLASVLSSALMPLALLAAGLGFLLWTTRRWSVWDLLALFRRLGQADLGTGQAVDQIVESTNRSAEMLRRTHTGDLNWNIVAIVVALCALLLVLLGGAQ